MIAQRKFTRHSTFLPLFYLQLNEKMRRNSRPLWFTYGIVYNLFASGF